MFNALVVTRDEDKKTAASVQSIELLAQSNHQKTIATKPEIKSYLPDGALAKRIGEVMHKKRVLTRTGLCHYQMV